MTRREAEALPLGSLVMVSEPDGGAWVGRMWCADAKWTADMRGFAVLHRVDPRTVREAEPASPYGSRARLVSRRRLAALS